ncbi:DUF4097 domain-containing protein [Candidatus Bipolaricaulota bacterium]|nr:DUF4097 domain-containing protein [Candidatus Bipolaricaulota bacterium]
MKRVLSFLLVLILSVAWGSGLVLAEPAARGFGFGGAMGMAFFPDMTGINTFMAENGLPSMGSFLVGAGGNGRGGVIGDLVFGGVGWGLMAFSESDTIQADLVSAGGGFDIGAAIGGDKGSVLTVGIVLGAGANILSLSGMSADEDDNDDGVTICGIIPVSTDRELVRVNGFVQPYVSMAAQLLPWMGFEFRLGYIFPVAGMDVGDLVGIPAPSLELSGPTVSFGFAFGGIGSSQAERAAMREQADALPIEQASSRQMVTVTSEGSFAVVPGTELIIENGAGNIVISSYDVDMTGGVTDLIVEWQAARTAKEKHIDELQAVVDVTDTGTRLSTTGSGEVSYVLRIPSGIDLRVKNGVGNLTVVGHEAQTMILENGVGDMDLQSLTATALIAAEGIGNIRMTQTSAMSLIAELGLGEIAIELPADTSARLIAKAKIGDVSLDRFPGMTGGVRGFLGKTANATLGLGEKMIELTVGLGEIGISLPQP